MIPAFNTNTIHNAHFLPRTNQEESEKASLTLNSTRMAENKLEYVSPPPKKKSMPS